MTLYATHPLEVPAPAIPELVDFRISRSKRRVTFYVNDGGTRRMRYLDMTRDGAGLRALNEHAGHAVFYRSAGKTITIDDCGHPDFDLLVLRQPLIFTVTESMAELLALVFWEQHPDADAQQAA